MAIKLYTQGLVENVIQDGNKLIFDYVGTKPDTIVEIGEGGGSGEGGGVPFAMTDVAYDNERNEFTFSFSDNSTKKIRLDGVSDVEFDTDTYNLTITFDNGTTSTYPLGSVSDLSFNSETNALTVTFADGTTKSIPIPTGGSGGESGSGVKSVRIEEVLKDVTSFVTSTNKTFYQNQYNSYDEIWALWGWNVITEYFDEAIEPTTTFIKRTIFDRMFQCSWKNIESAYFDGEFHPYSSEFEVFTFNISPYAYKGKRKSDGEIVNINNNNDILTTFKLPLSQIVDLKVTDKGLAVINTYEEACKYLPITPVTTGWEEMVGAGFHNSICRGNNLGSQMTEEQHNEILNGTFRNMYVGDYWSTAEGRIYIAAFDYFLHETIDNEHHIVVVPDYLWNTGAYTTNSSNKYRQSAPIYDSMTNYISELTMLIGANYVRYNELLYDTETVRSGDLLTIPMLGLNAPGYPSTYGYVRYNSKGALPLFIYRPDLITVGNSRYWLRDYQRDQQQFILFGGIGTSNDVFGNTIPCCYMDDRNNSNTEAGIRFYATIR